MALPPVVAIEIGTTKVVALVGEMRDDGTIYIVGKGEHPSSGVRKGEVIDLDNALVCLRSAITSAEETGRVTCNQVYLAVSGGHIQSLSNRGTIPVRKPEVGITDDDVTQVTDIARTVNLPPDRQVLHSIWQTFYVDGQPCRRPKGFDASQLTLDMLILHGRRVQLRNTVKVVTSLNVEVCDMAFSGICSAMAVLTPEQKEGGALVIDFGGGTTNYVAYAAGALAAAGSFGIGGDHVTNDIALAFNIQRNQAERLKIERGGARVEESARSERITVPAEVGYPERRIALSALQKVINLRTVETVNLIRRALERDGLLHAIGAGVVITGGAAQLRGLRELTEEIFKSPCALGKSVGVSGLASALQGPQYTTAVGLVRYAFTRSAREESGWVKGLFRRIGLLPQGVAS